MARVERLVGTVRVLLVDSITEVNAGDGGLFAVSGSHGGVNCAGYALRAPLTGVAYNDAGVGKNGAGIAALAILDGHGMPAVTVSNMTAVIGQALDTLENGVISHVNGCASTLGLAAGMKLRDGLLMVGRKMS